MRVHNARFTRVKRAFWSTGYHFSTGPGSSPTACAVKDKSDAQEGRGGHRITDVVMSQNEKREKLRRIVCMIRYMEARKKKIVDVK